MNSQTNFFGKGLVLRRDPAARKRPAFIQLLIHFTVIQLTPARMIFKMMTGRNRLLKVFGTFIAIVLGGLVGLSSGATLVAVMVILVGLFYYLRQHPKIPKNIPFWQIGLLIALVMFGVGVRSAWLNSQSLHHNSDHLKTDQGKTIDRATETDARYVVNRAR